MERTAGSAEQVCLDTMNVTSKGPWLTIMFVAVYNGWHETELERWLSDHGTET